MRQFTGEELKALEQYEGRFKSATELDYVRNLEPRYLNEIKETYDAAAGAKSSLNTTCAHCVLTFMKKVGQKYFEDKKAYQEKSAQLVKALDDVFGEVPDDDSTVIAPDKEPEEKPKKAKAKKTTKK